jgi:hypothetical protein
VSIAPMVASTGTGSHFVQIAIEIPRELDSNIDKLYADAFRSIGENVRTCH